MKRMYIVLFSSLSLFVLVCISTMLLTFEERLQMRHVPGVAFLNRSQGVRPRVTPVTLLYQGTYELNQRSICSRMSKYPVGHQPAPSGIGSASAAVPPVSRNPNFFSPPPLYFAI